MKGCCQCNPVEIFFFVKVGPFLKTQKPEKVGLEHLFNKVATKFKFGVLNSGRVAELLFYVLQPKTPDTEQNVFR